MGIADHISAADVILDLDAANKRSVLQALAAEAAARLGRPEQDILDVVEAREGLGSTALGRGAALPHALIGGDRPPVVLFARLRRPVEFDARDEEPVDIVILALWPAASSESFLPALSEICRSLREPPVLRRLRVAGTPEEVVSLLAGPPQASAAAAPARDGA